MNHTLPKVQGDFRDSSRGSMRVNAWQKHMNGNALTLKTAYVIEGRRQLTTPLSRRGLTLADGCSKRGVETLLDFGNRHCGENVMLPMSESLSVVTRKSTDFEKQNNNTRSMEGS